LTLGSFFIEKFEQSLYGPQSDFKNYIFGFLFLKRANDVFKKKTSPWLQKMGAKKGIDIASYIY